MERARSRGRVAVTGDDRTALRCSTWMVTGVTSCWRGMRAGSRSEWRSKDVWSWPTKSSAIDEILAGSSDGPSAVIAAQDCARRRNRAAAVDGAGAAGGFGGSICAKGARPRSFGAEPAFDRGWPGGDGLPDGDGGGFAREDCCGGVPWRLAAEQGRPAVGQTATVGTKAHGRLVRWDLVSLRV